MHLPYPLVGGGQGLDGEYLLLQGERLGGEAADGFFLPITIVADVANDIAIAVDGWAGKVVAGLHKAGGGSGKEACSADMLLEAVVGCAGVTLRAVATAMGVTIRGGKVIAEGIWDARGTLAIDRNAPVGLTEITLRFDVDCDADAAKLERMIQTTERYCVVLQTIKNPPKISVAIGAAP